VTGPCAKQTVTATIIASNGERFVGANDCRNPQTVCPRADMPTGIGYHLCKEVCQQISHAEIAALSLAGEKALGGVMYLDGHVYLCAPCEDAATKAGISKVMFGAAPCPK
jgi:deoxycytidylate deaminase